MSVLIWVLAASGVTAISVLAAYGYECMCQMRSIRKASRADPLSANWLEQFNRRVNQRNKGS